MNYSYKNTNHSIGELISKAECGQSVIPSIQRPFVWDPARITAYIDSLFRGWPFGTMLFLVCPDKENTVFQGETFFRGDTFGLDGDAKPEERATYMILDGQQRYQSILIAFSCKSKGFEQTEINWKRINCKTEGVRSATPIQKFLCFNLKAFSRNGQIKTHLQAANTEDANETAWLTWKTKDEIRESLGQYVKLYETPNSAYNREAADWLKIKQRDIHKLLVPVLEISDVEKKPFADGEAEQQIVEIFTRLNTQGCPLTREQILSAKITQVWDGFPDKIETLRSRLEGPPYYMERITDDDLVTGFNTLIIADKREKNINEAYRQVQKEEWKTLWVCFESLTKTLISELVEAFSIRYKKEYQSLHAIWFIIALAYRCSVKGDIEGGKFEWDRKLLHLIVKWLMLSNWSKIWSIKSSTIMPNLTNKITSDISDEVGLYGNLKLWLDDNTLDMKKKSIEYLQDVQASARGGVRNYYTFLLIWMRLNEERAKLLTSFEQAYDDWAVDHIIPAAWVKGKTYAHEFNRLGNCWLLNSEANIIKSDESFQSFCNSYGVDVVDVASPILASALTKFDKDKLHANIDAIINFINQREEAVKRELIEYIENDDKVVLSYVKGQKRLNYHFDISGVYYGKEYTKSAAFAGMKPHSRHDYFKGVQRALNNLCEKLEHSPFAENADIQNVRNFICEIGIDELIRKARLGNQTYQSGFRQYLNCIMGNDDHAKNGNQRGGNESAFIAGAICHGCSKSMQISSADVIDYLVSHKDCNRNSLHSTLSNLRRNHVFETTRVTGRSNIRFTEEFWERHNQDIADFLQYRGDELYSRLFEHFRRH